MKYRFTIVLPFMRIIIEVGDEESAEEVRDLLRLLGLTWSESVAES